MRERILRRKKEKKHETVLDDKVSGNEYVSVGQDYDRLQYRIKNMQRSLDGNSIQMKQLVMSICQTEREDLRRNSKLVDKDHAKTVFRKINKALKTAVGDKKAKSISHDFIQDARKFGFEKATDNLVHDVVKQSKRHSGRKLGSFSKAQTKVSSRVRSSTRSKLRSESKSHDKKIEKRETRTVEKKKDKRKSREFKVGVKEAALVAAVMSQTKDNTKATQRVEEVREAARSNEPPEIRLEKLAGKHVRMSSIHDSAVRDLRRTARRLRTMTQTIQKIHNAENGIEMNEVGESIARTMNTDLSTLLHYARVGESMVGTQSADKQAMQIDALLMRGRATMMRATHKTKTMRRSLHHHLEQETQRQRT